MAEILKITTPVVNKNATMAPGKVADPAVPFDITDIEKIIKPLPQQEAGKQQSGPLAQRDTASILMEMLTNPSVTVSFLKNISLLQEYINLLPLNNQTTIAELRTMFDALLISPEKIVEELMKQKDSATIFKGEMFDLMRQALAKNSSPEMYHSTATLLKAINAALGGREILDSIANNLSFLQQNFSTSPKLSAELAHLEALFRQPEAMERFPQLRSQVMALIETLGDSILMNSKSERVASILMYNISRYNDNEDFLTDALRVFLGQLDDPNMRQKMPSMLAAFLTERSEQPREQSSQIMDVLTKIIEQQVKNETGGAKNTSVEKIVHSLLSSPCNFTPLLHLVIPVEHMDVRSYAEIWIDHSSEQDSGGSDPVKERIQLLMVFDVEILGKFELELLLIDNRLNCMLLCPPQYTAMFEKGAERIRGILQNSSYTLESLNIDKLERQRSLMEVFKDLPYKRTGIDLRV